MRAFVGRVLKNVGLALAIAMCVIIFTPIALMCAVAFGAVRFVSIAVGLALKPFTKKGNQPSAASSTCS